MTTAEEIIAATVAEPLHRPPSLADQLLDRDQLRSLPEPEPLIDGTLDRRTVALLGGYKGSLKSFILLDWLCCVATGKRWQGRDVRQGRILYVVGEGAYGLNQRIEAWEDAWGHKIDPETFTVMPGPVNLLDRVAVAELCGLVAGCALVGVDTIARCAVGGDENSAKDMGIIVDSLYRIREATGHGAVVPVHHTGKDRSSIRGSSALEAGVDVVYTTEGDAKLTRLDRTKRKDGPTGDTLQFRLKTVLNSGVIVSSGGTDLPGRANDLLTAFRTNFASTGATKVEIRLVAGMQPSTFHRSLGALLTNGTIRNDGTDQRPFYRLTEGQR